MKPDDPREWLKRAKSNLAGVKAGKTSDDILYEDLCFNAEQAVEKALKALLVHRNKPFPKTHSIHTLFSLLEETGINIPEDILEAGMLTEYAVETRYPGNYPAVDYEDYKKAADIAERVLKWVQGFIYDSGFTIIELVLVLIITAILAAVAVPQLGRYWAGIKVGNAATKIASDIRYAQNRATTTQQRSQINFAAGGTSYTINSCATYTSSTCTCAGWAAVKAIDFALVGSSDYVFHDVTIATVPGNCIEFDSIGRPYYNTNCANPAAPCPSSQNIPSFNVNYSGSIKQIAVTTQTGLVSVN